MRRWGDLDSNNSVAAAPYCNGRATGFNKVLTRRKPVVCDRSKKSGLPSKASVVGFHRPDTGTAAPRKSQIPNPKLQTRFKLQISRKRRRGALGFGTWDLGFPYFGKRSKASHPGPAR